MSADDGRSPSSDSESDHGDTGDGERRPSPGSGAASPERDDARAERDRRDERTDVRKRVDAFLSAERGPAMVVREVGVSVLSVALLGLLLFALSGVWPPMVAVESGSMEPHMHRGDLVFVSEPGRYVPTDAEEGRGIVTRAEGEQRGYRSFQGFGSVVVYDSPGRGGAPVIHRAHFWVEEGENWYDEANPAYHDAEDCADLRNCPAPHAGFITKGDANSGYDQVLGISTPVRPDWVVGIAHVRVPYLGYVRLWLAGGSGSPVGGALGDASGAGVAPASERPGGGNATGGNAARPRADATRPDAGGAEAVAGPVAPARVAATG